MKELSNDPEFEGSKAAFIPRKYLPIRLTDWPTQLISTGSPKFQNGHQNADSGQAILLVSGPELNLCEDGSEIDPKLTSFLSRTVVSYDTCYMVRKAETALKMERSEGRLQIADRVVH